MYVSPLQPIRNAQVYVSGDVTVEESAAIAPGVILQADAGSRIVIASGACIGMGAILHARQGTLEVGAGAVIGAGVLAIGTGKIGVNACIGPGSTLIDPSIPQLQLLPAGSLIGDVSRQVATTAENSSAAPETPETPTEPAPSAPASPEPPSPDLSSPTLLYGQTHINHLLVTLFPHRKPINNSDKNGNISSGGS